MATACSRSYANRRIASNSLIDDCFFDRFFILPANSGQTVLSHAERHIHQQESDWLQGSSGSPFTRSDADSPPPTPFHPPLPSLISTSVSSPSFTLSGLLLSSSLFLSLPRAPSLSPTLPQAGPVEQEWTHGRPETSPNSPSYCETTETTENV